MDNLWGPPYTCHRVFLRCMQCSQDERMSNIGSSGGIGLEPEHYFREGRRKESEETIHGRKRERWVSERQTERERERGGGGGEEGIETEGW